MIDELKASLQNADHLGRAAIRTH